MVEDLQPLNVALSEGLCTLAHDLNNGLGIIAGYCELMLEKAEPTSESAERLRLMLTVVHRLAQRINEADYRFAKVNEIVASEGINPETRH